MTLDVDTDTLARTIYGEARGEGDVGLRAVASVVMNRCQTAAHYLEVHRHIHPLFGDGSPARACRVPWQFSCWNVGDPNCRLIQEVDGSNPVFTTCLNIAKLAVQSLLPDDTGGATYYYAKGSPTPRWARGLNPCAEIGRHLFFNNVS